MVLSIQGIDGDVDQMEDNFTAVHVSVRVLGCMNKKTTYVVNLLFS